MSLVLTLGLLVLPVIWFITDPRSLKERIKQYLTFKGILLLVIEYCLIYFNFSSSDTINLNNPLNIIVIIIGSILYILGLILAIWAKITMGKIWGRPAEHDIKRQNKLIVTGPFKFSRNPIYLGLILTFLGYSLALRSIMVILILFIIGFFYYSAVKEEKILEKHFGKKYLEYKSSVPRFF